MKFTLKNGSGYRICEFKYFKTGTDSEVLENWYQMRWVAPSFEASDFDNKGLGTEKNGAESPAVFLLFNEVLNDTLKGMLSLASLVMACAS